MQQIRISLGSILVKRWNLQLLNIILVIRSIFCLWERLIILVKILRQLLRHSLIGEHKGSWKVRNL